MQKNAQGLSGHFEHHSVIIEGILTDLGLGKVHFSTKIVFLPCWHPLKTADFRLWSNDALQSSGTTLISSKSKCAYFYKVRPFPWWLWRHHRRHTEWPWAPERSICEQNCVQYAFSFGWAKLGQKFRRFGSQIDLSGAPGHSVCLPWCRQRHQAKGMTL